MTMSAKVVTMTTAPIASWCMRPAGHVLCMHHGNGVTRMRTGSQWASLVLPSRSWAHTTNTRGVRGGNREGGCGGFCRVGLGCLEGSVVCVGELGVAAMKCIACVAGG